MINLHKLASQGRAYSASRCFTPEELDAVLALTNERHIPRTAAADHVRNGIMSIDAFDKATKAGFKPTTLADAHEAAEAKLKDNDFAAPKKGGKKK